MPCLWGERSKMVDGAHVYPALTWLPDMHEVTLVDTSVQLEHRREIRPPG